jgi:hypothetical protein
MKRMWEEKGLTRMRAALCTRLEDEVSTAASSQPGHLRGKKTFENLPVGESRAFNLSMQQ